MFFIFLVNERKHLGNWTVLISAECAIIEVANPLRHAVSILEKKKFSINKSKTIKEFKLKFEEKKFRRRKCKEITKKFNHSVFD